MTASAAKRNESEPEKNTPAADSVREVTPLMIETGVRVLRSWIGVWDRPLAEDEKIVTEIFSRMSASLPPARAQDRVSE